MKKIFLTSIATLFILVGCFSFSSDKKVDSKTLSVNGSKGFVLIELYTSEGCSSCPSADQLLKQIREEYKGKQVYVLAYHVDYWNRLGWKDKFSDHRFSERQSAYANNFRSSSVYTPQAVVNGKDEMVGSATGQLKNAINKYLNKSSEIEFVAKVGNIGSSSMKVNFDLPAEAKNKNLIVNLVQKDVITNVKAGENGGRLLPHANVVRAYQSILVEGNQKLVTIELPEGFKKEDYELISFVQDKNQGTVLGVLEIKL
ncbi:MAG: DUF1223 domain-containing protein [Pelobium sp.]